MKHIAKLGYFIVIALALTVFVAAQQSESTPQQQKQGMQGMEGMQGMQGQHGNTSQMMQECHKNMQTLQQTNEKARQEIGTAKQSNDPAKMRAALDEADKALAGVSDHMQKCEGMMQHMQGMSGMMSGQQKDKKQTPPKQ
jgi:hypothetical protein